MLSTSKVIFFLVHAGLQMPFTAELAMCIDGQGNSNIVW
jgi:hypothetical protein